jgi:hypothetical protein
VGRAATKSAVKKVVSSRKNGEKGEKGENKA